MASTELVAISTTAIIQGINAKVEELWKEKSSKINEQCRHIELDIKTIDSLGPGGEAYFAYHCSLRLGKPAEFCFDGPRMKAAYLGNPDEMEAALGKVVIRLWGDRFPVLHER